MDVLKLYDLVASAQINFQNLEKLVPSIKNHPMYMIAKKQLDDSVDLVEDANLDEIARELDEIARENEG